MPKVDRDEMLLNGSVDWLAGVDLQHPYSGQVDLDQRRHFDVELMQISDDQIYAMAKSVWDRMRPNLGLMRSGIDVTDFPIVVAPEPPEPQPFLFVTFLNGQSDDKPHIKIFRSGVTSIIAMSWVAALDKYAVPNTNFGADYARFAARSVERHGFLLNPKTAIGWPDAALDPYRDISLKYMSSMIAFVIAHEMGHLYDPIAGDLSKPVIEREKAADRFACILCQLSAINLVPAMDVMQLLADVEMGRPPENHAATIERAKEMHRICERGMYFSIANSRGLTKTQSDKLWQEHLVAIDETVRPGKGNATLWPELMRPVPTPSSKPTTLP
jgi:hypothetical protein